MSLRIQSRQPTVVNLLSSPEDFSNASWVKANIVVTPNDTIAPDGTMTADKLTATNGDPVVGQWVMVTAGIPYTTSVYVKAGSASSVGARGFIWSWFTSDPGSATGPMNYGRVLYTLTNDWQQTTITFTPSTSGFVFVRLDTMEGNWTYAPGDFMYAWGASLIAGATPLLYSNDFANWGMNTAPNDYVVTSNATTAPDGTQTASFILKPAVYGGSTVYNVFNGKLGGRYRGTIYLKSAGYSNARINFENSAFDNISKGVDVDLNAGTIYNSFGGATATIVDAGDAWRRIDIFATAGTTNNYNYVFAVVPLNNQWQGVFTGDGTSGIYMWTGQVTEDVPVPYYPQSQLNSGIRLQSTQLSPLPISSALLYLDGNDPAIQGQGVWNDLSGHSGYAVFLGPVTYSSNDGGSLVFNGTSTYASLGNSNDMNFGSGDFTINFWMKPATWGNTNNSQGIIEKKAHDGTAGWTIYNDSTAPNKINARLGYQNNFLSTSNVVNNQWQNWTLVRNGTNIYWYLNGTLDASGTSTESLFDNNAGTLIGHTTTWDGYFDGRLSTIAVYTHALTASQILQEFEITKTRYGFAPTSGFRIREAAPAPGSLSFNGTNQNLRYTPSTDWDLGLGDFTVEWWQYMTGTRGSVFSIEDPASNSTSLMDIHFDNNFIMWFARPNGSGSGHSLQESEVRNQWVHFAVSRHNGLYAVYKNGSTLYIGDETTTYFGSNNCSLIIGGMNTNGRGRFPGKITNFRLVKGTAIYTDNFTAPTAPLEALANTKLLLLTEQRNPLKDSSGLDKQVTNVGNTPWDSSTPF